MFGIKESLLAEFARVDDPARAKDLGFSGWLWAVEHNFVRARKGGWASEWGLLNA